MTASPPGAAAVDVDAVAVAVAACPSVLRLMSGLRGDVATHPRRRRMNAVRLVNGVLEVHVVARWVAFLPDVGDEVRTAVEAVVGSRPVAVFIDDLERPALEARS